MNMIEPIFELSKIKYLIISDRINKKWEALINASHFFNP